MPANAIPVVRSCPLCARPGRPLTSVSKDSVVDYYRCDECHHVWHHRKDEPNAPAVNVTTTTPQSYHRTS